MTTPSALAKVANALVPKAARPDKVGPRVTALRETLALSKSQLADSLGLDRSTLTKIEKGKIGLDIQHGITIADRYGFGLNFIYRGDVSDTPDRLRARLLVEMVTADAN